MDMKNKIMLLFLIISYCYVIKPMNALPLLDQAFLRACKNGTLTHKMIETIGARVNFNAKDPENDFTGLDYLCNNKNFELKPQNTRIFFYFY